MATILAVYAHPDDEVFGTGGTLVRYAKEGHTVKLICATKGERGKITDPEINADADVATLREQELKDCCRILGIDTPIFLGYHDSGRLEPSENNSRALLNINELEIEKVLLKHIAEIKPNVIISFDPHGIYGHIDHIKIHRAVTAAFWSAGGITGPIPKRLFYSVMPTQNLQALQKIRKNSPLSNLDPTIYGATENSFAAVIDVSDYLLIKMKAISAHRSQVGPNSTFANIDAPEWQEMLIKEAFTLGGLRGSFPTMPVNDLLYDLD